MRLVPFLNCGRLLNRRFQLGFILSAALVVGSLLTGCAAHGPAIDPVFGDSLGFADKSCSTLEGKPGQILSDKYCRDWKHANLTQKVLATAYTQFGLPYKYGGNSPKTGFDCSGFTMWTFAQHGIKLPRTSSDMISVGTEVKKDEIKPGDLVVFKRYRDSRGLHVGIYVGDGLFIHSPHTGDRIKESSLHSKNYTKRYITTRRVLDDPEPKALPTHIKAAIIKEALGHNDKPAKEDKKQAAKISKKATKSKPAKTYKIRQGDTIWKLAKEFGVTRANLIEANNLRPNATLRPGQKLSIPE